jgi:endonuclease/exonuclease/phosphatase family metal-dependent hydrolase
MKCDTSILFDPGKFRYYAGQIFGLPGRLPVLILFLAGLCTACSKPVPAELRVMSFNIWVGGGKSAEQTAKVIAESGADIVGIQEATRKETNTAAAIAEKSGWYSYTSGRSTAIISKYAITDTSASGKGVKIQIDKNRSVWMFNVHLIHCPYEPYQLNGIEYCGAPLLGTAAEAIESAQNSRIEEVMKVVADINEIQKEKIPIFLTGDFNEPSCLDWTPAAVAAGLCIMPVEWPSTKAFQEQANMKDSYRTVFPDEVKFPGHTWTPLPEKEKYTEIPDRIDFVFFGGEGVKVFWSEIAGEIGELSDIKFSEYPSDHRAVISTFKID